VTGVPEAAMAAPLGLSAGDVRSLARTLCAARRQNPEGMLYGFPGAPDGAYWDGGITDYHLHLNWNAPVKGPERAIVLYPHFQKSVVPGWLDKALKWRHGATPFLDSTIVLAPNPDWVKTLPGGKLPDRKDFMTYDRDLVGRVKVWIAAAQASEQLAQEFAHWLAAPSPLNVQPL
jgi:hypothetical protein